ncbi:MAG: energy-coupled thiamine transporter ThiT [Clostridiales bacterium]|nr:energy-coupled thiamine transporter ThiT [Clostridiales bacterium]
MLEDIKYYFANFDDATNACRTIALWITVALVVAFIASKLYVAIYVKATGKYDGGELAKFNKLFNGAWITVALTAAVCYIITFSTCYFVDVAHDEDVLVPILFYPLLVLAIAIVASAIAIFVKPVKLTKIVSAAAIGGAFIAALVCLIVYYTSGDAIENNGTDVFSNLGLYLSAVFVAAAIVVLAFFVDRTKRPFDTRTITFAAICVALSFALSYVRIFKMPMGGSITFASMLPLMLFAFMFGSRKGVFVGLIYGILQAVQDPMIIHPAQFALDYAVAFAAIGLTGCIRDLGLYKNNMRAQFALGAAIACLFRFISHYFAGVFAFGVWSGYYAGVYNMPALANEYFYSFVYQCMYLIPELLIVLVVSVLVLSSKSFRRQIEIYSDRKEVKSEEITESAKTEEVGEQTSIE